MAARVGIIGAGHMGNPMSRNLLKKGFELVVFDIDRNRIDALTALGAKPAETPADVARQVDFVMISLPNLHALEDTVIGDHGILAQANSGLTIIDTCTSLPDLTRRMAAAANKREVRYVDAPLSGTTPAAEAATLVVMAGGDPQAVAACQPIFDAIGSKTVHCGEVGMGHAMKLVINLVLVITQLAGYEGMALGTKLGLNPDQIYDVIRSGAADSYIVGFKLDKVLRRDFDVAGSLGIVLKDISLANEMARAASIPLALPGIAEQVCLAGKQAGLADLDSASIIMLYEKLLGIEVRGEAASQ